MAIQTVAVVRIAGRQRGGRGHYRARCRGRQVKIGAAGWAPESRREVVRQAGTSFRPAPGAHHPPLVCRGLVCCRDRGPDPAGGRSHLRPETPWTQEAAGVLRRGVVPRRRFFPPAWRRTRIRHDRSFPCACEPSGRGIEPATPRALELDPSACWGISTDQQPNARVSPAAAPHPPPNRARVRPAQTVRRCNPVLGTSRQAHPPALPAKWRKPRGQPGDRPQLLWPPARCPPA